MSTPNSSHNGNGVKSQSPPNKHGKHVGRIERDIKPREDCEYDLSVLLDKYTAVGTVSPVASTPTTTKKAKPKKKPAAKTATAAKHKLNGYAGKVQSWKIGDYSKCMTRLEAEKFAGQIGVPIDVIELEETGGGPSPLKLDPEIDVERQLVANALKTPPDKATVMACRVDRDRLEDVDLGEIWGAISYLVMRGEHVSPKQIIANTKPHMLSWGEEEIEELTAEADGKPILDYAKALRDREKEKILARKNHSTKDLREALDLIALIDGGEAKLDDGIDVWDLAEKEIPEQWYIPEVLVEGDPMFVGALSKTLKTSIEVDMCLALNTATPFLGHFEVPKPVRCALFSGESGPNRIQDIVRRIAKSRGLSRENAKAKFAVHFRLPKLSNAESLAELRRLVVKHKYQVIVIDPLYLCMLGGGDKYQHRTNTASVADVGELFGNVIAALEGTGCTPIMVHHFSKGLARQPLDTPASLEDFAGAGVTEHMKQWIHLSRREKYNHDGEHRLRLMQGGSAGHDAEWFVAISEGKRPNRKWEVSVKPLHEVEALLKKSKAATKHFAVEAAEQARMAKVLEVLAECGPLTANMLRKKHLGGQELTMNTCCTRLVNEKLVEQVPIKGCSTVGYKILPKGTEWLAVKKKAEEAEDAGNFADLEEESSQEGDPK